MLDNQIRKIEAGWAVKMSHNLLDENYIVSVYKLYLFNTAHPSEFLTRLILDM